MVVNPVGKYIPFSKFWFQMWSTCAPTAWGVAPTHLAWGEPQRRAVTDHLWSVGNTPFGTLAGSAALAFPQADAVRRHVVTSQVNATLASAARLLGKLARVSGGERALAPRDHAEYTARWNVLRHKQQRALAYAAMHDYERALHYARSAAHDIDAMVGGCKLDPRFKAT